MSIKLSGAAVGRLKQWCSEHSVTRVYFTETAGAAGGMVRTEVDGDTLTCRIVPIYSREILDLRAAGLNATHRLYFASNPGTDVDEYWKYCTRYFAVKEIRDPDELEQYWIVTCEERKDID